MSDTVQRFRVIPYYHVVVVQAEDATDLPIPETGLEAAVATGESVLVATRPEGFGEIVMEVRRGAPDEDLGALVYDGELSFTTPRLAIGSPMMGEVMTVDVGRIGWIPIRIYVDPPGEPDRVVVVIP